MRILIYSILVFLIGCKEKEQPTFEVEGELKNANAQTVYLEESVLSDLRPVVVDSAKIEKDGSFHLETLSKEESIFSLRLDQSIYPFVSFVNDSKEITVNADFILYKGSGLLRLSSISSRGACLPIRFAIRL